MSLLEDVFLEDEAGEAQELERVIEADDYDERPLSSDSDDNEEKEDEAEEDKRHVDPKKPKSVRVVKNPRFILNPARLTGPRGIHVIPDHFKDFKFKGNGHEKEDLDMVMKKLEHWAYRLYPKFGYKDCLKKIEMLGKKRPVMVNLIKIRSNQFTSEETVVQKDSSDDEVPPQEEDEFDKLLQQQIELARSTPAPESIKKPPYTPSVDRSMLMPKATSSPSISVEQRDRMLRNRKLAEERRLAKIKNDNSNENKNYSKPIDVEIEGISKITEAVFCRKQTRSNVIDSSDDEEMVVNQSIFADIHNRNGEKNVKKVNEIELDDEGVLKHPNVHSQNNNNKSDITEINPITPDSTERVKNILEKIVDEPSTRKTSDIIADTCNKTSNIINTSVIANNAVVNNKEDQDEINFLNHIVKQQDNKVSESEVDSISVANKENLDNNMEDIMNVDFSDDF